MKMKVINILIVFLLLLTGCLGGGPKKYSNKDELVFWHSMSGQMGDVLKQLVEEYNSTQDPAMKVRPIYKGNYSSLIQSLLAGIPAKNLPDITQAYESWTSKFIDNDIIVPLEDYFRALPKSEQDDFYKVLIDNNTFNGKLWSIPFNKSVPVMYYNKDMFEKYGINPPQKWSLDPEESEFDRVCSILTKDDDNDGIPNQWGYAFNVSVWIWECLLLQAGGRLVDETGKKVLFNEAPGRDSLEWWKKLLDRKYSFKTAGFDFQNNFAAGNVGMIITSSVSKSFLSNKMTFNMAITEVPYYLKRAVVVSGTNVVVLKTEKARQDAAWKFLAWLISPEITAKWAVKTNYLPLRRSALETEIFREAKKNDPYIEVPLSELAYAYFEPASSGWYNSRNIISDAVEIIMLGIKDNETALTDAAKKVEAELNK